MGHIIIILLITGVFYIFIPGLGAFYVRKRWRMFRKNVTESSLFPIVTYRDLRNRQDGFIGYFRFMGCLQAIQGDDIIWVSNGDVSLSAEFKNISVYLLPSLSHEKEADRIERNKETLPEEMPKQVSWRRISALPEGTEIYISGGLFAEQGGGIFKADSNNSLTVVIYDGIKKSLLRRSIWGGRHNNEYMNMFTPGSMAAGSLALFIFAYSLLHVPLYRFYAVIVVTFGFIPLIPFVPPGVALLYLYRYFWKKGRILRAERDLLRLPLRYFKEIKPDIKKQSVLLPTGEKYIMLKCNSCETGMKEIKKAKIRIVSLLKEESILNEECYAFGVQKAGDIELKEPDDPMAELIIIPGNPDRLASLCSKEARKMELFAAGSVFVGFTLNLFIVFTLLSMLLR